MNNETESTENLLFDNPDVIQMTEINEGDLIPGIEKGKKKKKKHWVIWTFVIFFVLLSATAAIGIKYLYDWSGEKLALMNQVHYKESNLEISKKAEKELKNYRNILIMGIDKRKGEDIEKCRSDAMIIASVNKKSGDVKMISVVRDSFLLLDESGEQVLDKLTHAHAYGGPENTIRALNRNLDLNIKEFVRIDWQTVADTVDCLGGLELKVKRSEIREMNKYIRDTNKSLHGSRRRIRKPGMQKLNGIQVVTYCRIRKNDGDENRAERYRTAMMAALKKAKSAGFDTINKTADTVLPQITTNISPKKMRRLIIKYFDAKIKESKGWPYTWDGAQLGGIWYDVPITLVTNDKNLHKDIFEQKNYKTTDRIQEINQMIIDQTGYDENQPAQVTNKKSSKKH